MSWLIYGAVGYLVYKLAKTGQLELGASSESSSKKKKKTKKRKKKKRKKPRTTARPPHEVLGVEPDASAQEIRQAYQELMRKYHPDRVANAADELRDLAHQRSKEINAAYEAMRAS
jgi:preprotein translocase subunit Sec63